MLYCKVTTDFLASVWPSAQAGRIVCTTGKLDNSAKMYSQPESSAQDASTALGMEERAMAEISGSMVLQSLLFSFEALKAQQLRTWLLCVNEAWAQMYQDSRGPA